jgi:glucokinase
MQLVLAGDIGGTKTRLALVKVQGTSVSIQRECSYPSQAHAQFDELLGYFLQDSDTHIHAALGIAGPIKGRVVSTTNLPWYIDADALQQRFGLRSCNLLNDLEATACGLPALRENDLLTLQAGTVDAVGNQAVIAAGTGLGEAGLYWDGHQHRPFATEGGHASFTPSNQLEFDLLVHLQQQFQHVSWERVVSGMGIVSIYEFLCIYRNTQAQGDLPAQMRAGDAAAVIAQAALQDSDALCGETMLCFVRLYGAEAGNVALKMMSRGGLFIGGGIAPKILPLLQDGEFLNAFLNKGRMRHLLEAMTIKVILNDRAALYGPALYAAATAGN